MDERDLVTSAPDAPRLVDELGPRGLQALERSLDVGDPDGDVVQTLAPFLEELRDGRRVVRRLEKLEVCVAERKHRLGDPIGLARFDVVGFEVPDLLERGKRRVHGPHRYRYVVDLQQASRE